MTVRVFRCVQKDVKEGCGCVIITREKHKEDKPEYCPLCPDYKVKFKQESLRWLDTKPKM